MRNYTSIILILLILSAVVFQSCSDNIQKNEISEIVYSKSGLVDSLTGTCSTFLVRNFVLDSLDFSGYTGASVRMNSFADGDLSEIGLYYLNADTAVFVFRISGTGEINSGGERSFQIPGDKRKYFLRMKLFSSVCTGQLFSLTVRDFYLYGRK